MVLEKYDENTLYLLFVVLCQCFSYYFICAFQVHNTIKNHFYDVDLELTLCSCPEGFGGKFCKHLLVALKNSEPRDSLFTLPKTEFEKKKIFFIATGKLVNENDNWFKPLASDECR